MSKFHEVKTHSNNGKPKPRYTMWVHIKPEFAKGNMAAFWTYNPDNERKKFAEMHSPMFFTEGLEGDIELLKYIFHTKFNRFQEIKKFDNTRPFNQSMFEHWVNGERVYPEPVTKFIRAI